MPKEQTIAERIKAARQKLGLSQSQAAKEWGINLFTLQQWEREKHEPKGLYREKLDAILDREGC